MVPSPGSILTKRGCMSQTWFGCGCYFVGNVVEHSCHKHFGTTHDYYKVWGDQVGVRDQMEEFARRLREASCVTRSVLARYTTNKGE